MIQLGSIGPDKARNLVHAREMVVRAARSEKEGEGEKVDLVMLPVSLSWTSCRLCLVEYKAKKVDAGDPCGPSRRGKSEGRGTGRKMGR